MNNWGELALWVFLISIVLGALSPSPAAIGVILLAIIARIVVPRFLPPVRHHPTSGHHKRAPIPQDVRWSVFIRDGYQCVRCGARHDLHVDHIVPHAWGGSDDPANLQTLCRKCNLRKGARYAG